MLIRVRRKQSMAAVAGRYHVSVAQLKAWNKTKRDMVKPGQLIVLHVPVGKPVPAEPGPQKIATTIPAGVHVEKVDARASDVKPAEPAKPADARHSRAKVTKAAKAATASIGKRTAPKKAVAPSKPARKVAKAAASREKIASAAPKSQQQ
jgi:membrane-bound lytic murein transglycosylase D